MKKKNCEGFLNPRLVTLDPRLVVRWLNAKFRLDGDKSDKSMKVGTKFAYTLPDDIRRGAHVNMLTFPF